MIAMVAGGSGLIGGHLVDALNADERFTKVLALVRREGFRPEGKVEAVLVNFDVLESRELPRADVAFCCLGTTIAKAGSKDAFRAVDHDAVLSFARAAKKAGAKKFLVVTAMGADAKSMIFYNRVKGEVERALTGVGFESLVVFRPSLLLGERGEVRKAEKIAMRLSPFFSPLFVGPLANYKPIDASRVARAMVTKATRATEPFEVVSGHEIFDV
jgi:uncharacterized protein YbjT (DUF2867 family)